MGQRDGGDALGVVRLGVGQPAQFGHRQRGYRHRSDHHGPRGPALLQILPLRISLLRPTVLGDERLGGCGRTCVVPQQRVADHLAGGVECDHPVLLAAHCGSGDIVEPPAASAA